MKDPRTSIDKKVCSVETSRALKEIGYDKITSLMYGTDFQYNGHHISFEEELDLRAIGKENEIKTIPFGDLINLTNTNKDNSDDCCSAPFMHDAEDWLRDEFNIHVSVQPKYSYFNHKVQYYNDLLVFKEDQEDFIGILPFMDTYDDYWECLDQTILKATVYIKTKKLNDRISR